MTNSSDRRRATSPNGTSTSFARDRAPHREVGDFKNPFGSDRSKMGSFGKDGEGRRRGDRDGDDGLKKVRPFRFQRLPSPRTDDR